MKRIYILLVVLLTLSGSAFAQFGGTPSKAQDSLAVERQYARTTIATDVQLVAVFSLDTVSANGICNTGWGYGFSSVSKDSAYIIVYVIGTHIVKTFSLDSLKKIYSYSGNLDPNWVNSDVALAAADAYAGNAYRASNPGASVQMLLAKGIDPPYPTLNTWGVIYKGGATSDTVYVNAVTGVVLNGGANSVSEQTATPATMQLDQNYPNPFSASTAISFTLNTPQNVMLGVYDALGRQVATLASGHMDAGVHNMAFDASSLPQGIYFYKLTANGVTQTHRMMVVK